MGYVRMSDLSGPSEPNPAGKASLSTNARALAAQARSLPTNGLHAILSQAQGLLSYVTSLPTWDENQSWNCGLPLANPCWDNKTTVRQNLQIAVDTARSRMARAAGQPVTGAPLANQAPVQSVNLARETAVNLPGAVRDVTQERAAQAAALAQQARTAATPFWDRAMNFFGVQQPQQPTPAQPQQPAQPQPTATRPTSPASPPAATTVAPPVTQVDISRTASEGASNVSSTAVGTLDEYAQRIAGAASAAEVNTLWNQSLSVSSQASNNLRSVRASSDHFAAVQSALMAVRSAKDRRLSELGGAAGSAQPVQPQSFFSTADKLSIVQSITQAASAVGTAFVQGRGDVAAAKAARPKFVPLPPMTMPQPRPTQAPAGGLGTTEVIMIGAGVVAVAGVGLILLLRSGDEDED